MDQKRRSRHKSMHLQSSIFDKRAQNIQWRKDSLLKKCCGNIHIQSTETRVLLSHFTKINSKWIKDFNIMPETLKQLQEAVGNTLEHIDIGNDFLNRTQKAQHLRDRMNKWDCIKLKNFCTAKETATRLKRQPKVKNYFPAVHLIRD
jgi:hypothetical protein